MVKSINFVILGDYSIAMELGKKGTESDIAIYNRKTTDTILQLFGAVNSLVFNLIRTKV